MTAVVGSINLLYLNLGTACLFIAIAFNVWIWWLRRRGEEKKQRSYTALAWTFLALALGLQIASHFL